MSDLFFHMANNNNNDDDDDDADDQILLRPKRMYYRVAYLINKVLKVPFETTVLSCIFCYRVCIFLSVSSLIFKLFSTDKATSFICLICYLTFLSLYVSVNFNWVHPEGTSPTGNPRGLAQKTCPRGRDLTQSGAPSRVIGWTNFSH